MGCETDGSLNSVGGSGVASATSEGSELLVFRDAKVPRSGGSGVRNVRIQKVWSGWSSEM